MRACEYTTFQLDLYLLSGYLNNFILYHFHIHVNYLIATKLEEGLVKIVKSTIETLSWFLLISLSTSFRVSSSSWPVHSSQLFHCL